MRQRRSRIFQHAPVSPDSFFIMEEFIYTAETEEEAKALAEKHPYAQINIVEWVDVPARP